MADQEQLEILKQMVELWNAWRGTQLDIKIDLSRADFTGAELHGANLHRANLREADLNKANLWGANLKEADLYKADIRKADLRKANLWGANLHRADLSEANLRVTHLGETNLRGAYLCEADLRGADLRGANLHRADLSEADLRGADLYEADLRATILRGSKMSDVRLEITNFADVDLSETIGLENARHFGPSTIGTDTIQISKGKIPDAFLRGCGLSDWEIAMAKLYDPDLSTDEITDIAYKIHELRAGRHSIQISPLFISYSHADSTFVEKVDEKLNELGIRFWRDVHDLKAGRLEKQIDRAIRHNPTVLLVLSEHSTNSDWVEHEVGTARELEKELKRDVLCPVALDGSWRESEWPKRLMRQVLDYNILDFSAWEDDKRFGETFKKLVDGLALFYQDGKG